MSEETPVRIPSRLREDAFFYDERNMDELYRTENHHFFVPPPKGHDYGLYVLTLGTGAAVLTLALMGFNAWIAILLFGLLAMLGMMMYAPFRWKREFHERFSREGYVVPGEIITCIAFTKPGNTSVMFMVEAEYRYRAPNGEFFVSSIAEPRPDLEGTQLPPPGTPVYILYFSEHEAYLL